MWSSVGVVVAALVSSVTAVVVTLLNREKRKSMRMDDTTTDLLVKIAGEVGVVGEKVDVLAVAVQDLVEENAREHALLWASADKISL